MSDAPLARMIEPHEHVAAKAKYRPAAPGDGFGGIFLDSGQLAGERILRAEAVKHAEHFREEEDSLDFGIGCSCFEKVRAFVYTIEAARCLCAG